MNIGNLLQPARRPAIRAVGAVRRPGALPDSRAGERGAIGLLVLLAMLVFSAAALVVLVAVTDVAVTVARARTAADAAALAAVAAAPLLGGDGDTCRAAAEAAAANGARLLACRPLAVPGAPDLAGSGVRVEVALVPGGRWGRLLDNDVRAAAAAGLRSVPGVWPSPG
jgi:hypothetical protein